MKFLNTVPKQHPINQLEQLPAEFQVDETYLVPDVGVVAGGILTRYLPSLHMSGQAVEYYYYYCVLEELFVLETSYCWGLMMIMILYKLLLHQFIVIDHPAG